jgi:hypothetical protein
MSRGIPKEEHMQAKELFKLLVREQLGPLLRSEGFVLPGSRGGWSTPAATPPCSTSSEAGGTLPTGWSS